MDACKLSPRPASPVRLVEAGQSDRGMEFAARYCDFNFAFGEGVNTPTKGAAVPARMAAHAAQAGRDVGSYLLYMIIADETDAAAMAKWDRYNAGADQDALAHLLGKAAEDTAPSATSMAATIQRSASPINFSMGTLVGSYSHVAAMLDEVATMPGVKGIMLTFDDFLAGIDSFGTRIQPLMRSRNHVVSEPRLNVA
jgi:pyrimidine oxygenase